MKTEQEIHQAAIKDNEMHYIMGAGNQDAIDDFKRGAEWMQEETISNKIKVRFKKLHKDAVLPKHSKQGDAGMDLTVVNVEYKRRTHKIIHHYGVAVEIPEGNVGLLFPRSSINKVTERLSNSVGVIDSGYRGELMAVFDIPGESWNYIEGDRTAQLVIVPYVSCVTEWAKELTETERGTNGYGSTGK